MMFFSSTDLPVPDGPMMALILPLGTSKEMSSRTVWRPEALGHAPQRDDRFHGSVRPLSAATARAGRGSADLRHCPTVQFLPARAVLDPDEACLVREPDRRRSRRPRSGPPRSSGPYAPAGDPAGRRRRLTAGRRTTG